MSFFLPDQTVRGADSYDEACRRHAWKIPPRYNIAVDICDRRAEHEGCALVWNDGEGQSATYSFRDLKRLSDQLAEGLAGLGLEPGARAAVMLP